MGRFGRNRWFALAGGFTLAFAVVSLTMRPGPLLTSISDLSYLLFTVALGGAVLAKAWSERGANRWFWALMGLGCVLWVCNPIAWTYYEVGLHKSPPDPWSMDIVLFVHLIPMIAAAGLRPHLEAGVDKFRAGALDFVLLAVWWVFLYAFLIFPAQYISLDVAEYDRNYCSLYVIESGVLVLVLGLAARGASGGWKTVYRHLMAAGAVYALDSEAINMAVTRGTYHTGSLYDAPLIGSVAWMAATVLTSRKWKPEAAAPRPEDKWSARTLQLAMLAILSLPVFGLWTFLWDTSSGLTRTFRLFTALAAMLVMGVFVFLRQFIQDRKLIHLLEESRRSFESTQRLQTHLVQREKLASLGQLIAGAAQEIDQPLTAIMQYSENLWSNQRLTSEQDALVRKIVNHSQRTRDLIANLLSFAQQSSGQKMMVDLSMLLQRSLQMRELQRRDQKIRIEIAIEANLPKVWGDGHQLFQTFVQIVENALDALEGAGGGVLRVVAERQGEEVVVQFCDNGPGLKEPDRVFDPFYTTKPVGKGTGLGLSAVYGVVQDHRGQITCQNNPEGGAMFVLRLPVIKHEELQALAAARA